MSDAHRGDYVEEAPQIGFGLLTTDAAAPGVPELHGVLEAELPRPRRHPASLPAHRRDAMPFTAHNAAGSRDSCRRHDKVTAMPHDRQRNRLDLAPMSLPNVIRFGAVTTRLGSMLLPLVPQRVADMKAGRLPSNPTFIDHMLVVGLVRTHQQRGTLDELTPLHDWFWSRESVLQFHEFAERRFEHWFLGHHVAIVPQIREALGADEVAFETFCEIGCGCGRALEYMAQAFPEIPRFIGLDLSEAQTARNRARYTGQRMEFESGDGLQWVARHARPQWVYFIHGGVLEFFSRARVLELFSLVGSRLAPSLLAMVESVSDDHDLDHDAGSIVYGAENTFSHNLIELLRLARFDILHRSEQRVDGQRWLLVVARSRQAQSPL